MDVDMNMDMIKGLHYVVGSYVHKQVRGYIPPEQNTSNPINAFNAT